MPWTCTRRRPCCSRRPGSCHARTWSLPSGSPPSCGGPARTRACCSRVPRTPMTQASRAHLDALRTLAAAGAGGRASIDRADGGVHLLVDGPPAWRSPRVVADLYRIADALFLPSREEGFGLPVLEAGVSRLPVICADIPALRELAGDDATYVDPDGGRGHGRGAGQGPAGRGSRLPPGGSQPGVVQLGCGVRDADPAAPGGGRRLTGATRAHARRPQRRGHPISGPRTLGPPAPHPPTIVPNETRSTDGRPR